MTRFLIFLFPCAALFMACNGRELSSLEAQLKTKNDQLALLEDQLQHQQASNASLLQTLSELSVINKVEAQSIQSSLESLNRQNQYIQDLTERIHEKDSINFVLVSNLKRSLDDIYDEDIAIQVKGSAVYISIADKMLFTTASSKISERAYGILEKVARIVNDHDDLNVMVEGHTDAVPISNSAYVDNWDLSVSRATSVVRILEHRFGVNPSRLTAAGRAYHNPKSDNDSYHGRSLNRRTEIIITPKLDQFFELLKADELAG